MRDKALAGLARSTGETRLSEICAPRLGAHATTPTNPNSYPNPNLSILTGHMELRG